MSALPSAGTLHTVIVGAGFSGIGAAIKLREAGFDDFVILEDGDGVGGTWHWNTYPGVAVDIPSFSYQFSFAQRANWSRTYAKGHELKEYADALVEEHDLKRSIRFNSRVERAVWQPEDRVWTLELRGGDRVTARFLVNASGVLTTPKAPDIPGIESFRGTTVHTARWDPHVDIAGKRVGVIGTGASAIQLIPEIAPDVAHLTVFQRTPIWCFPKPDLPLPRWIQRTLRLPGGRGLTRLGSQAFVEVTFPLAVHYHRYLRLASGSERVGRWWLSKQVDDPEVRAKLTPAYGVGCKRPSFHNGYLATYNRDNVHLETTGIKEITRAGVRTLDGVLHKVDVLVLATGFKVMEADNIPTYDLIGETGETLAAFWQRERLQAYQGVSVPGFPNFFTVFGPYGYNGSSYFALIETQVRHILRCLKRAEETGADRVEVTQKAHDDYFRSMIARRGTQVFFNADCGSANSYYFDEHGDVALRPASTLETVLASRTFPLTAYTFTNGGPS